jgi:3-oxoacyl-[acyl-carrier-protein] synthase III
MAGETEFSIDLAKRAVIDCLARSKYNPEDIDLLICGNISRCDRPNYQFTYEPGTALRLKHHFGFKNAIVFDLDNACTGLFTAMYIIDAFLKAGLIRRGLAVSGEYITHLSLTAQKELVGFMDSRLACLTVGDSLKCLRWDITAVTALPKRPIVSMVARSCIPMRSESLLSI